MVRKLDTKVGKIYWMFSFFRISKASFTKLEQLMVIVKSLLLNTSLEGKSYTKCASQMVINHKYQSLLTQ